jgi:hypothetical protein
MLACRQLGSATVFSDYGSFIRAAFRNLGLVWFVAVRLTRHNQTDSRATSTIFKMDGITIKRRETIGAHKECKCNRKTICQLYEAYRRVIIML